MDKKVGIFYGSATGTTAAVARKIAESLGVANTDIHDVAKSQPSDVAPYDLLVLGSSTWGSGDLEDDWYDFVDGLESVSLKGKKIALFGCGDETMTDTFCNAVGTLYSRLLPTGAEFVGFFNTDGYDYDSTSAMVDGNIVGLLIDDVNHSDLTDRRIKQWVEKLEKEI